MSTDKILEQQKFLLPLKNVTNIINSFLLIFKKMTNNDFLITYIIHNNQIGLEFKKNENEIYNYENLKRNIEYKRSKDDNVLYKKNEPNKNFLELCYHGCLKNIDYNDYNISLRTTIENGRLLKIIIKRVIDGTRKYFQENINFLPDGPFKSYSYSFYVGIDFKKYVHKIDQVYGSLIAMNRILEDKRIYLIDELYINTIMYTSDIDEMSVSTIEWWFQFEPLFKENNINNNLRDKLFNIISYMKEHKIPNITYKQFMIKIEGNVIYIRLNGALIYCGSYIEVYKYMKHKILDITIKILDELNYYDMIQYNIERKIFESL